MKNISQSLRSSDGVSVGRGCLLLYNACIHEMCIKAYNFEKKNVLKRRLGGSRSLKVIDVSTT